MSKVEANQYFVPTWDCPCGSVNAMFGQDDATGSQQCEECMEEVEVIE